MSLARRRFLEFLVTVAAVHVIAIALYYAIELHRVSAVGHRDGLGALEHFGEARFDVDPARRRNHEEKLVTAPAVQFVVRTKRRAEQVGALAQEPVTCRVTERVVDGLEVVEISNHDSAERAASHLQTNALLERTTVQRVRESIVERGPAQVVV